MTRSPPDAVDGERVMIVYKGEITPLPRSAVLQYPKLADVPKIEVAPIERDAAGMRRVNLYRLAPGIAGFSDTRLPAVVDEIPPGYARLVVRGLKSGSYAVAVNGEFYELGV